VSQVRAGVLDWLESIRFRDLGWGRWPYHAKMRRPYGLQSSFMAMRILRVLGALDGLSASERAEGIAWLQSTQDPADGHFKDPLVTEADHVGKHTWEQIYGQWSGAIGALAILGGCPRYPLPRSRFYDLDELGGEQYTMSFRWENPWSEGEGWSRGIQAFLESQGWRPGMALPVEVVDAMRALEAHVLDEASGTPSRRMLAENRSVAMAGRFKTMYGYMVAGVPMPLAERAIDSTLALQHEDGDWGIRRNMCIVWDSLWVLRECNTQLQGAYRRSEIEASGIRTAEMLLRDYRQSDGAFAFNGVHCVWNHHSVQLCDQGYPISDTMGTMMVVNCLQYVDEWNEGRLESTLDI